MFIHQIENQNYEESLLGQTNFDKALTPELRTQTKLAVKEEYTFGFLELGRSMANGNWSAPWRHVCLHGQLVPAGDGR